MSEMSELELRSAIESFPVWHYEFDFNGVKTPARHSSASSNRHRQRARHFFEPLVKLAGGLKGKRVLDLGCNAGFWSLKAIEAGADFVFGIDGRQMHVDQADLVFRAKGISPDRYHFVQGDIFAFDFSSEGPFDVVLCLGLLYHVSKTVELFEKIAAASSDLLVIETKVSLLPGAVLEMYHESLDDTRNAIDHELVLVPSRRAVAELAEQFGYTAILLPLDTISDFAGMQDYRDGKRAAFICAKKTPVSSLEAGNIDLATHPLQLALDRQLKGLDMRLHRRRVQRNPTYKS